VRPGHAALQLLNANFFLVLKLLSKQNMHLFDSILMAVFASAEMMMMMMMMMMLSLYLTSTLSMSFTLLAH
jgi:hypothetical protein